MYRAYQIISEREWTGTKHNLDLLIVFIFTLTSFKNVIIFIYFVEVPFLILEIGGYTKISFNIMLY